jgi:chaperonin GroEL (HSP60 family)
MQGVSVKQPIAEGGEKEKEETTSKPWSLVMSVLQGPYKAVGAALEVIPRTLAQNCGANVIRTLTQLRARHADPAGATFGIDGNKGVPTAIAARALG